MTDLNVFLIEPPPADKAEVLIIGGTEVPPATTVPVVEFGFFAPTVGGTVEDLSYCTGTPIG